MTTAEHPNETLPFSVTGGFVIPYERGPLSKRRMSWPFGRLTLTPTAAELGGRGILRRLGGEVILSYDDIVSVEHVRSRAPVHWAETLRFRTKSNDLDRVAFATFPPSAKRTADMLRSRGVAVLETHR